MKPLRSQAVLLGALFVLSGPAVPAQQTVAKTVTKTAKKLLHRSTKTANKAARATKTVAKNLMTTPLWPSLESAYQYDNSAPPDVKEQSFEKGDYTLTKISFTGLSGKPVEGVFLRPKSGDKFPCALALHGLTQSKEIAVNDFGKRLVAHGIAVLALDAPEHGSQRKPGKNMWQEPVIRVAAHDGVQNYRRALDWLATRQDVDMDHIGLVGLSLGSITGAILGGVDNRIRAFAFCVGGDPILPVARAENAANVRHDTFDVSPSLYIGHISPRPILMINGRTDPIIVAPAAMALQKAAQEPKQVVWYNGTHDVPPAMKNKAVDWLTAKIKSDANTDTNSGSDSAPQ